MNAKIVLLPISILFKSQTRQKTIEKDAIQTVLPLHFDLRNGLRLVIAKLTRLLLTGISLASAIDRRIV